MYFITGVALGGHPPPSCDGKQLKEKQNQGRYINFEQEKRKCNKKKGKRTRKNDNQGILSRGGGGV